MRQPRLDRRSLLAGGAAAGGLTIAFLAWPRRRASPLRPVREGEQVFGPFLRIAPDGRVTLAVPQAETGQGAWTALAQIAADALGADWAMMAVEPAPLAPGYDNRLARELAGKPMRLTAGSSSIRAFERPLREAGTMARAMLCAAAARRWSVDAAECDTAGGFVVHDGKRLGFGELANEAARIEPPKELSSRTAGAGGLVGQSLPRLDLPAKRDGSWRFAGDVRLPEMRFASVRMAPTGGRLAGYNRAMAKRADVVLVERRGWLAAVGPTWWAAEQALKAAEPHFVGRANADTPSIEAALLAALEGGSAGETVDRGDYAAATNGRRPLAATYVIAPAPHLSLEPPSAVARWSGGRLEVWAATQAPDLALAAAAKAGGIDPGRVSLYPMSPGDGGGRAIDPEAIAIAVELAKAGRKPVALTLPAATALNQDRLRPPWIARLSALPNPAGGLDSWHARIAGAAGLASVLGTRDAKFPPAAASPPYAIGAVKLEAVAVSLPIRLGYLRGGDEALGAFITESFIDELARARGVEPLAFRIGLLGGQRRLARVLSLAAASGGWDGGGRGSAMGIACASAFGSHIGLLAEASIGTDQRVKVDRLVAAVDCGRIVNPGLVRQQIEGGLLHALTNAIGPAPEIVAGMPRARPLGAMGLGRLSGVPKVQVELIDSKAESGGVSGLGACVLAAAVGNALFAATGQRLRRLPFDPMSPA